MFHVRKVSTSPSTCSTPIERLSTRQTSSILSSVLATCNRGSIFAGTGQYQHTPNEDRLLLLNLSQDFPTCTHTTTSHFETQTLLDCSVPSHDIDSLMDEIKQQSPLSLYTGEMDFVDSSPWQYGFTLKPFSIFCADERVCGVGDGCLYLSVAGEVDVLNVNDVDFIGLSVSSEPYNRQRLFLQ